MPVNPLWYLTPIFLALAGGIALLGWGRRLWKGGETVGGGTAIACGAVLTTLGSLGLGGTVMVERRVLISGTVVGFVRHEREQHVQLRVDEEPSSEAYVRQDLFATSPNVGDRRALVMEVTRSWLTGEITGYSIELPEVPGPTGSWLNSQRVDLLFGRGRPYRP